MAFSVEPSTRSVAATNRRLTAEHNVDRDAFSTSTPTGSSPAPYRRVESLASIRSIAMRPRISVEENSSYEATGTSAAPSAVRTRGRRTGTRRPPKVTDPASVP